MLFRSVLVFAWLVASVALASERMTVSAISLIDEVAREFVEKGYGEDVELEIFGGKTSFELTEAKNIKIMITDLDIDEDQNKFEAKAEIFADGTKVDETGLLGRFFVSEEIYVPVMSIAKGEIIKEETLQKIKVRSNRLRDDVLKNKEDLLGKQVVRTIAANKPVSRKDVREEIIVKKGQSVVVVYKYKGLEIVSKMEALEDGARGQTIKLMNMKSEKTLKGKVLNANMIEVVTE